MKDAGALALAGFVGAGAFAIYAISETTPLVSGAYLGANLYLAYEVVDVLILVSLGIYAVGRYRMKSMGIDPRTVFTEIPPE